ncbi:MAG: DUF1833 domain-containing protein [Rhodobacteraceae bacterium]|nr:DUF1833 domain-containing protein [Paracoccaceae bacterium]MBR9820714.1 DUF1833 domain-containing protein [Paracoccaceae bacterium]
MTIRRDIPDGARQDFEASSASVAYLGFLTITHPNLVEPIRLVSDVFSYIHDGDTYVGLPFEWSLVRDTDGRPEARLTVANTDRRIGQAVQDSDERARLSLKLLASSDFDLSVDPREEIGTAATVYAYAHFELANVEADVLQVSGVVTVFDPSTEPWPSIRATQDRCPGLFR